MALPWLPRASGDGPQHRYPAAPTLAAAPRERGWTQAQAAQALGVTQSRISDLVRGKWDKFSLDMLVTLAVRSGQRVHLALDAG